MTRKVLANGIQYEFSHSQWEKMLKESPRLAERLVSNASQDESAANPPSLYGPEFEPGVANVFFKLVRSDAEAVPKRWEATNTLDQRQIELLVQLLTQYRPGIVRLCGRPSPPLGPTFAPEKVIWNVAMMLDRIVTTNFDPVSACPLFKFNIYDAGRIIDTANTANERMHDESVQSQLAMKILAKSQQDPAYISLFRFVRFSMVGRKTILAIMNSMKGLKGAEEFVASDVKGIFKKIVEVQRKARDVELCSLEALRADLSDDQKNELAESLMVPDPLGVSGDDLAKATGNTFGAAEQVLTEAKRRMRNRGTASQGKACENATESCDVINDLKVKPQAYPATDKAGFTTGDAFQGDEQWPWIDVSFGKDVMLRSYSFECLEGDYMTAWTVVGITKDALGNEREIELDRQVRNMALVDAARDGKAVPVFNCELSNERIHKLRIRMDNVNWNGYRRIHLKPPVLTGRIFENQNSPLQA